ncbi:MAG: ATP-binding protein [Paludibacteraceae bacterium]|nr:ATP-binding protein [Paludibacteraceae bacterium]
MIINRQHYIQQLENKSWNGKVKIITGIRRCGKSYLLSVLYKQHLMAKGVKEDCFVEIDLEKDDFAIYRNPIVLHKYIVDRTKNRRHKYYVFIDEIQRSYKVRNSDIELQSVPEEDRELLYTTFYDTLSSLMALPNVDVYVTGSNSKMLSTDIVTNFRDRGSEIRVYPLTFAEYYPVSGMEKADALEQYLDFGGMPLAVLEPDEREKQKYLADLHKNVYLKDIVERYHLKDDTIIDALTDTIYSAVGSLTNPHKLANVTGTVMGKPTADSTIKGYLEMLSDAYLIQAVDRFDIKGKRYFESIRKYYAMDLGLRNARLNFRQVERSHLMENLIYLELIHRGYRVDVGVVDVKKIVAGKQQQSQYEIDFVVNTGRDKVYIQSALNIDSPEKRAQETFSLHHTSDSFRKMVILDGNSRYRVDEDGVAYIGVIPFLLQADLLEKL